MTTRSFGRRIEFDERSRQFPIRALLPVDKPRRSYTWKVYDVLNQGNEGACTGFSVTHEAMARPCVIKGLTNDDARGIYYRARQLDEWPGECVDDKTTCLTSEGWKNADTLNVGDDILGFDLNRQGLRWAKVQKVHRYEKATYRVYEHDQIGIAATANHKWLVGNRNSIGPLGLVQTMELNTKHYVPRVAPMFEYPTVPVESDDFVQLVAWSCTEGHFRKNRNEITISQKSHKSHVAEMMERLGVPRGFDKTDGCHSWSVCGELAKRVRKVCTDGKPSISWLRTLTRKQLLLWIDSCMLGDGSCVDGEKWGRQNRLSFHQKPGLMLDAFLAACVLAGVPISRATAREVETWSIRRSAITEIRKMEPSEEMNDSVWCPQSQLGTFVARRGDSIFLTGNSYEGSSVLAAMKAGQENGWYDEYRWAFSELDLALSIGYRGPCVLGINWYEGMCDTDKDGLIHVTGNLVGGHAILCNGYNVKTKLYRLHNSWGMGWGKNGECFIRQADLAALLREQGEACIPVVRTKP